MNKNMIYFTILFSVPLDRLKKKVEIDKIGRKKNKWTKQSLIGCNDKKIKFR